MTDKARSNSRAGLASGRVSRRRLLKSAAGIAGAAVGSGMVKGFPTVWAQNIKDVTLTHVGMSYSTIIDIARQATKDLGFKVQMAVTDHPGFVNRVTTQPDSVDVADGELWQSLLVVPRGVYQAIDVKKIKLWDKMTPIYTKGTFEGKEVSRVGVCPFKVQYCANAEAKSFAKQPTEYATFVPGFYNADTLGMRPDLIKKPIEHWSELFDPEFKGKAAIQDIPAIGIMDAAMAAQSQGAIKYGDMGNMTRPEIDKTIAILIDLKKKGHWRALWSTFDESVNLMTAGEVVIQSMWSPAVTAVRAHGVPCYYVPLKEGYRGWGNGLGLMRHLTGI
jgi:putative spermidine/putrescine transport system substrate-binding protein